MDCWGDLFTDCSSRSCCSHCNCICDQSSVNGRSVCDTPNVKEEVLHQQPSPTSSHSKTDAGEQSKWTNRVSSWVRRFHGRYTSYSLKGCENENKESTELLSTVYLPERDLPLKHVAHCQTQPQCSRSSPPYYTKESLHRKHEKFRNLGKRKKVFKLTKHHTKSLPLLNEVALPTSSILQSEPCSLSHFGSIDEENEGDFMSLSSQYDSIPDLNRDHTSSSITEYSLPRSLEIYSSSIQTQNASEYYSCPSPVNNTDTCAYDTPLSNFVSCSNTRISSSVFCSSSSVTFAPSNFTSSIDSFNLRPRITRSQSDSNILPQLNLLKKNILKFKYRSLQNFSSKSCKFNFQSSSDISIIYNKLFKTSSESLLTESVSQKLRETKDTHLFNESVDEPISLGSYSESITVTPSKDHTVLHCSSLSISSKLSSSASSSASKSKETLVSTFKKLQGGVHNLTTKLKNKYSQKFSNLKGKENNSQNLSSETSSSVIIPENEEVDVLKDEPMTSSFLRKISDTVDERHSIDEYKSLSASSMTDKCQNEKGKPTPKYDEQTSVPDTFLSVNKSANASIFKEQHLKNHGFQSLIQDLKEEEHIYKYDHSGPQNEPLLDKQSLNIESPPCLPASDMKKKIALKETLNFESKILAGYTESSVNIQQIIQQPIHNKITEPPSTMASNCIKGNLNDEIMPIEKERAGENVCMKDLSFRRASLKREFSLDYQHLELEKNYKQLKSELISEEVVSLEDNSKIENTKDVKETCFIKPLKHDLNLDLFTEKHEDIKSRNFLPLLLQSERKPQILVTPADGIDEHNQPWNSGNEGAVALDNSELYLPTLSMVPGTGSIESQHGSCTAISEMGLSQNASTTSLLSSAGPTRHRPPTPKSPKTVQEWVDSLPADITACENRDNDDDDIFIESNNSAVSSDTYVKRTSAEDALPKRRKSTNPEEPLNLGAEASQITLSKTAKDNKLDTSAFRFIGDQDKKSLVLRRLSRSLSREEGEVTTESSEDISAKRFRFSEGKEKETSFQSETSVLSCLSHQTGSSIEDLLESRQVDPVDVLLDLGFGGGDSQEEEGISRLPDRFMQPSKVAGNDLNSFLKQEDAYSDLMESSDWVTGINSKDVRRSSSATISPLITNLLRLLKTNRSLKKKNSAPAPRLKKEPPPEEEAVPPDRKISKFISLAKDLGKKATISNEFARPILKPSASKSVLNLENRKFLDQQGRISPEVPHRRVILGTKSFFIGRDDEIIHTDDEDNVSPLDGVHSPSDRPLEQRSSTVSLFSTTTSIDSREEELLEKRHQLRMLIESKCKEEGSVFTYPQPPLPPRRQPHRKIGRIHRRPLPSQTSIGSSLEVEPQIVEETEECTENSLEGGGSPPSAPPRHKELKKRSTEEQLNSAIIEEKASTFLADNADKKNSNILDKISLENSSIQQELNEDDLPSVQFQNESSVGDASLDSLSHLSDAGNRDGELPPRLMKRRSSSLPSLLPDPDEEFGIGEVLRDLDSAMDAIQRASTLDRSLSCRLSKTRYDPRKPPYSLVGFRSFAKRYHGSLYSVRSEGKIDSIRSAVDFLSAQLEDLKASIRPGTPEASEEMNDILQKMLYITRYQRDLCFDLTTASVRDSRSTASSGGTRGQSPLRAFKPLPTDDSSIWSSSPPPCFRCKMSFSRGISPFVRDTGFEDSCKEAYSPYASSEYGFKANSPQPLLPKDVPERVDASRGGSHLDFKVRNMSDEIKDLKQHVIRSSNDLSDIKEKMSLLFQKLNSKLECNSNCDNN